MKAPFGVRLGQLRSRVGLTRSDLAARAGLSVGLIVYLETGESWSPAPPILADLARGLGMTPAAVLGLGEVPSFRDEAEAVEAVHVLATDPAIAAGFEQGYHRPPVHNRAVVCASPDHSIEGENPAPMGAP